MLLDCSRGSNNRSLFARPAPPPCYPVLCKLGCAVSGFAEDSRGLRATKTASPQLTYVVPAAPLAPRRQWDSYTDLPTRMLYLITPTIVSSSSFSPALPRRWSPHHGKSLAQEPFALTETSPSTVAVPGRHPYARTTALLTPVHATSRCSTTPGGAVSSKCVCVFLLVPTSTASVFSTCPLLHPYQRWPGCE